MKKRFTLKKNYEFRRLYRRGASAAGGCMVVYCRRNRLGRCRLGLTASAKLGNAVQRNRARRRLREVFRLNLDALRPGFDVILVARGRTLTASWKELNSTFLRLCKKLGMTREAPPASPRPAEKAGERMKSSGTEKTGECVQCGQTERTGECVQCGQTGKAGECVQYGQTGKAGECVESGETAKAEKREEAP